MLFRSCSRLAMFVVAGALVAGSAGCMKAKKKPEVRLPRGSGSEMASLGADKSSFGSHSWSPSGAPGSNGLGSSGDMALGGDGGFGADPNAIAYDPAGGIPNDASLAGVEAGTFVSELEMVHFPFDSAEITPDWQTVLDGHASWLASNGNVMVQVEGHCDDRGTEEYNTALGQRRADAVREYLASRGVAPERLSTISYGEMRPLVFEATEEAHMLNRRAMFLVYEMNSGGQQVAGF